MLTITNRDIEHWLATFVKDHCISKEVNVSRLLVDTSFAHLNNPCEDREKTNIDLHTGRTDILRNYTVDISKYCDYDDTMRSMYQRIINHPIHQRVSNSSCAHGWELFCREEDFTTNRVYDNINIYENYDDLHNDSRSYGYSDIVKFFRKVNDRGAIFSKKRLSSLGITGNHMHRYRDGSIAVKDFMDHHFIYQMIRQVSKKEIISYLTTVIDMIKEYMYLRVRYDMHQSHILYRVLTDRLYEIDPSISNVLYRGTIVPYKNTSYDGKYLARKSIVDIDDSMVKDGDITNLFVSHYQYLCHPINFYKSIHNLNDNSESHIRRFTVPIENCYDEQSIQAYMDDTMERSFNETRDFLFCLSQNELRLYYYSVFTYKALIEGANHMSLDAINTIEVTDKENLRKKAFYQLSSPTIMLVTDRDNKVCCRCWIPYNEIHKVDKDLLLSTATPNRGKYLYSESLYGKPVEFAQVIANTLRDLPEDSYRKYLAIYDRSTLHHQKVGAFRSYAIDILEYHNMNHFIYINSNNYVIYFLSMMMENLFDTLMLGRSNNLDIIAGLEEELSDHLNYYMRARNPIVAKSIKDLEDSLDCNLRYRFCFSAAPLRNQDPRTMDLFYHRIHNHVYNNVYLNSNSNEGVLTTLFYSMCLPRTQYRIFKHKYLKIRDLACSIYNEGRDNPNPIIEPYFWDISVNKAIEYIYDDRCNYIDRYRYMMHHRKNDEATCSIGSIMYPVPPVKMINKTIHDCVDASKYECNTSIILNRRSIYNQLKLLFNIFYKIEDRSDPSIALDPYHMFHMRSRFAPILDNMYLFIMMKEWLYSDWVTDTYKRHIIKDNEILEIVIAYGYLIGEIFKDLIDRKLDSIFNHCVYNGDLAAFLTEIDYYSSTYNLDLSNKLYNLSQISKISLEVIFDEKILKNIPLL